MSAPGTVNVAPGIDVIVRGWLNANQTVLWDARGASVVDTGYHAHSEHTVVLLRAHTAAAVGYQRVLNTHCHSDHMGGNVALKQAFGCSIHVPEGEYRHIVPWDAQSLWLEQTGQYAPPFVPDAMIRANDVWVERGQAWQAVAAPGHDMDALMFWHASERILISGDALWRHGTGLVWPTQGENPRFAAALEALSAIERLNPRVVIPGHGPPFSDVDDAIAEARSRLHALAKDPRKAANLAAKSLFVFALLEKGRLARGEAEAFCQQTPAFNEFARDYFGQPVNVFAQSMIDGLIASGAVKDVAGVLVPTMAA